MSSLESWIDRFQRDGYVVIEGALSSAECAALRAEIDVAMAEYPAPWRSRWLRPQMFLRGPLFEELLDRSPVFDLVERLLSLERGVSEGRAGEPEREGCHVLNVTSCVRRADDPGDPWHIDDYLLMPRPADVPWDERIPFPVYIVSALYYLGDVDAERAPTQLVPGSQKSGRKPAAEDPAPSYLGRGVETIAARAGDCLLFHSQVWHRGAPHRGGPPRYVQQVHYGARFVTARHFPMPNFHVPADLLLRLTPRRQRLLGMHPCLGQYT